MSDVNLMATTVVILCLTIMFSIWYIIYRLTAENNAFAGGTGGHYRQTFKNAVIPNETNL
jgi:hypothetical protein